MHEFDTFVYLDMEKTGSTFISKFLNAFSTETRTRQLHHRPMEKDCDPGKFYFISVRHPMDAYLSLYSFGCQAQGKVGARLRRQGLEEYYDGTLDGFSQWLRFVLKPKHADALKDGYHSMADGRIARLIGLQSYRYLRLAVPDAETLLQDCRSKDDIRDIYRRHKIPKFTVRYENFVEDLCALVEGPLAYAIADLPAALEHIRNSRPVNASDRVDADNPDFRAGKKLRAKMQEREWLLNEAFGY